MLDASTVYQYELIKAKELADRLMVDKAPTVKWIFKAKQAF